MENDFEKLTKMLQELEDCLLNMNGCKFFSVVRKYVQKHPLYSGMLDELDTRRSDYQRLLDSYANSMEDPSRTGIYLDIRWYMIKTYLNIMLDATVSESPVLQAARQRASKVNLLEIQELLCDKASDLDAYNTAFSAVLVSWMWDEKATTYFDELVVNPNIDIKPKLLIITAVTLACSLTFDLQKFKFLRDVYNMDDIAVDLKQRALVGWVFSSCYNDPLYANEIEDIVSDMLDSEEVRKELVALQKQIIFTMDAEKDGMTVDKDILSNMKSNSIKSILNNEPLESSLSDIIHPEIEEEKAEKLEQSVFRMVQMEKDGSDIYFRGFAHMKNFGFFHSLYNWFMPFYAKNPLLSRVAETLDGDFTFLNTLETSSPFCDSDKYSFAFGMEMTVSSTPSLKSLMKENFLFAGTPPLRDGIDDATFVRRMYLQDLYRFFRVSSFSDPFTNPFEQDDQTAPCYFLSFWYENDICASSDEILDMRLRISRFLLKRKDYQRLDCFSGVHDMQLDTDSAVEQAYYKVLSLVNYSKNYEKAVTIAMMLEELKPNDERILKLLARCLTGMELYEEAAIYYKQLLKLNPSDSVKLQLAACYLKADMVSEGLKILQELYYLYPDKPEVLRLLSWGYLLDLQFWKASEFYHKLGELNKKLNLEQTPEDIYNIGVCCWMSQNNNFAIKCFVRYSKLDTEDGKDLYSRFLEDLEVFEKYDYTIQDVYLMADIVRNKLEEK